MNKTFSVEPVNNPLPLDIQLDKNNTIVVDNSNAKTRQLNLFAGEKYDTSDM
jgi:hypothetical protein